MSEHRIMDPFSTCPQILMVTREQLGEQLYGLGKSLVPVIDELRRRGFIVRYLTQQDLPERFRTRLARCQRWLGWLPGLRGRSGRQALVAAWTERLAVALLAVGMVKRQHYTHVHLHDPWLACGFRVLRRLFRLGQVRWGVTEHGFGSYARATHDDGLLQSRRTRAVLCRLEAAVLAAADWVVVPTRLAMLQLADDLRVAPIPAHWRVIPHARPADDVPDRCRARRELGWPSGQIVVLGIGRLVPLKRFDLLIRACATVSRTHPLHLVLLGGGDTEGLWQEAQGCGLQHLTITTTERVPLYIAAADIYVSTSQSESFGLANLEALAGGLPAICTAVGGVPEVVEDAAWLIPADDAAALVGALTELVGNPALRSSLGARARQRFLLWPDIDKVGNAYAELYR